MQDEILTPLGRFAFKPTREDYEARLARLDARPVSISLVLAGAVATGLVWGVIEPGWFGDLAVLPVIGFAALVLFGAAHLFRRLRRAVRVLQWRAPDTPTEVEEFHDRLVVREGASERAFPWERLASISVDGERVWISASRRDVFMLPARAFDGADHMRAFVRACEARMRDPQRDVSAPEAAASVALRDCVRATSETSLGVDVSLTRDDLRQARAELAAGSSRRDPSLPAATLAAGIAGGLIAGAAAFAAASGLDPQARLIAAAATAWPGAILLTFFGARRIQGARGAEWPPVDPRGAARRIEIDEAGLISRGADFETRIAWAGVDSIRETEHQVLFITRWKEIHAVPKRCFADADAGAAFTSKARAFKTAS